MLKSLLKINTDRILLVTAILIGVVEMERKNKSQNNEK